MQFQNFEVSKTAAMIFVTKGGKKTVEYRLDILNSPKTILAVPKNIQLLSLTNHKMSKKNLTIFLKTYWKFLFFVFSLKSHKMSKWNFFIILTKSSPNYPTYFRKHPNFVLNMSYIFKKYLIIVVWMARKIYKMSYEYVCLMNL